jgi:hypothetical protein
MQPVSRQRIGKHVPAVMNTNMTIQLPLETVFSTSSVESGYKKENWGNPVSFQLSVQWRSAREATKIEAELMKLKNLHC